jgi:hypothetical protein
MMRTYKVTIEATIELDEDEHRPEDVAICLLEGNTYDETEMPIVEDEYFRVIDYQVLEVEEQGGGDEDEADDS